MRNKRLRIFGPKNYETGIIIRDIAPYTIERIGPSRIPLFKTMKKPISIKSRDIRASAS